MGQVRDYVCECGYQKRLFLGGGMNGRNLQMIQKHFPRETETFQEKRQNGKTGSYLLSNASVECSECKELYSVPCFTYESEGQMITVTNGKCPTCESTTVKVRDEEHINCPKCGRIMEYHNAGMWD